MFIIGEEVARTTEVSRTEGSDFDPEVINPSSSRIESGSGTFQEIVSYHRPVRETSRLVSPVVPPHGRDVEDRSPQSLG